MIPKKNTIIVNPHGNIGITDKSLDNQSNKLVKQGENSKSTKLSDKEVDDFLFC